MHEQTQECMRVARQHERLLVTLMETKRAHSRIRTGADARCQWTLSADGRIDFVMGR